MLVYCFVLNLRVFAFKGQNITFTVNVLLTRILYSVKPGPAMIRAVCEYSRLILITVASCHICAPIHAYVPSETP